MSYYPICSICKSKIDINLTIFHECGEKKDDKTSIINCDSNSKDLSEEDKYYCYNPLKNIHLNAFFHNLEFIEIKNPSENIDIKEILELEIEAKNILLLLVDIFFSLQNYSIDFNEPFLTILEKEVMNYKNSSLEPKLLEKIQLFILDIFCLILVLKKCKTLKKKTFLDFWTRDDFIEVNKYKENVIEYFEEYIQIEEEIKKGEIYFPESVNQ